MTSVTSAAMIGERNHEINTGTMPPMKGNLSVLLIQVTALPPPKTSAKPTMPPMIECVVDTGSSM